MRRPDLGAVDASLEVIERALLRADADPVYWERMAGLLARCRHAATEALLVQVALPGPARRMLHALKLARWAVLGYASARGLMDGDEGGLWDARAAECKVFALAQVIAARSARAEILDPEDAEERLLRALDRLPQGGRRGAGEVS